jgi:hypothetical protein
VPIPVQVRAFEVPDVSVELPARELEQFVTYSAPLLVAHYVVR